MKYDIRDHLDISTIHILFGGVVKEFKGLLASNLDKQYEGTYWYSIALLTLLFGMKGTTELASILSSLKSVPGCTKTGKGTVTPKRMH